MLPGVNHADAATVAFGEAPYGATNRVRGVPKGARATMRTQPLGLSVELPMGPRNATGVCRNGPSTRRKRRRTKMMREEARRRVGWWSAALRFQNADPTHRRLGKKELPRDIRGASERHSKGVWLFRSPFSSSSSSSSSAYSSSSLLPPPSSPSPTCSSSSSSLSVLLALLLLLALRFLLFPTPLGARRFLQPFVPLHAPPRS